MRVAQNRSAWCELWRPSASSGMNSWDDDDDIKYILNLSDLHISISEIQWHEEKAAKYLRYPMGFDLSHIYVTEKRHAMGQKNCDITKREGCHGNRVTVAPPWRCELCCTRNSKESMSIRGSFFELSFSEKYANLHDFPGNITSTIYHIELKFDAI